MLWVGDCGGQSLGLASLSSPQKGVKISTALVKPFETCLDLGMGKVLPCLSGAVASPSVGCGTSMGQDLGASQ